MTTFLYRFSGNDTFCGFFYTFRYVFPCRLTKRLATRHVTRHVDARLYRTHRYGNEHDSQPLDEILDLARPPPRLQYTFYHEQRVVGFEDKLLEFVGVERPFCILAAEVGQSIRHLHRGHLRAHEKRLFRPIADVAFLER